MGDLVVSTEQILEALIRDDPEAAVIRYGHAAASRSQYGVQWHRAHGTPPCPDCRHRYNAAQRIARHEAADPGPVYPERLLRAVCADTPASEARAEQLAIYARPITRAVAS